MKWKIVLESETFFLPAHFCVASNRNHNNINVFMTLQYDCDLCYLNLGKLEIVWAGKKCKNDRYCYWLKFINSCVYFMFRMFYVCFPMYFMFHMFYVRFPMYFMKTFINFILISFAEVSSNYNKLIFYEENDLNFTRHSNHSCISGT